jgi:hypothetical protein
MPFNPEVLQDKPSRSNTHQNPKLCLMKFKSGCVFEAIFEMIFTLDLP